MFRSLRSIAVSCFCSGGSLDPCLPLPRPAPVSLFSVFCKKPKKLNPLFSHSSALFKKAYFANSFSIKDFRTLLQNTGGVPSAANIHLPRALATHHSPLATILPVISTYKTDTKQTTLSSFRMNVYAKPREFPRTLGACQTELPTISETVSLSSSSGEREFGVLRQESPVASQRARQRNLQAAMPGKTAAPFLAAVQSLDFALAWASAWVARYQSNVRLRPSSKVTCGS